MIRKCTGVGLQTKLQEEINDQMDDIKLFAKHEKQLESLIQTTRI